jgi:hypothetical protein
MASDRADGVTPSGVDLRVARPLKIRPAVGFLLAGAAVVELCAGITKPAGKAAPPAPAGVHGAITPEAVAGPPPATETVDSKQMLQELLAKAGLRPDFGLRHLTWDQARRLNAMMPKAPAPLDAVKPFVLSTGAKDGRQALTCLTQAAYYEAGSNGPDAEAAVVQVVLNRVRHPDFPKSVCGVVYQGSARNTGCQFTFTCDGSLHKPVDAGAWSAAHKVAARALNGYVVPSVGASTYYHADYVFPTWAPSLVKTATVGPHIFYRMAGEEGQAAYLTGKYAAAGELKLGRALLRAADSLTQKGAKRAAEATLQLASSSVRIKSAPGERVHAEMASAPSPDAQLNAAQTIKPPAPVLPAAPVVQAQAPVVAPLASAASVPAA